MYYSKIRIILPEKHILKHRIILNKSQPENKEMGFCNRDTDDTSEWVELRGV